MARHIHAFPSERHAFGFQSHALFQARIARQPDVSACAQHPMPGDTAFGIMQRPSHLARGSGESGGTRDIPIRRHAAFRNPGDRVSQLFQHLVSVYARLRRMVQLVQRLIHP